MADYDKLAKALRVCSTVPYKSKCPDSCPMYGGATVDGDTCDLIILMQASDAIEELGQYANNIRRLKYEGWYLQQSKYHDGYQAIATMPLPEPPKEDEE